MNDIAPDLYKNLKGAFDKQFQADRTIQSLYEKVKAGTASYKDAHAFAIKAGEILAQAFGENLSSALLPDGKLYYNIAKSVVDPLLKGNYDLVTDVCAQVQKRLNRNAGIGMNAIKPELNQDRIDGILNRVSSEPIFDDVAWILGEPVVNFTQSVVDDSVKSNADFQYRAGLDPKITRISAGKCCKWCSALVGTYDYDDVYDTGNDVFRRHENCRCLVLFKPGDGSGQNVHSKKWTDPEETAKIETRKQIGLDQTMGIIQTRINQGQYSLQQSHQQYLKHVEGTPQFKQYAGNRSKNGKPAQGRLLVGEEEAQRLITNYSGKGKAKITANGHVSNVEFATADHVVGQYISEGGQWVDTKRFAIHHGKNGSHIVPVKEN